MCRSASPTSASRAARARPRSSRTSTRRKPSAGPAWSSTPASRSSNLLEVLREEVHRPLPRELGRLRVVLEHVELLLVGGLVGEGVLCVIAVELEADLRFAQLLLESIDAADRE